MAHTTAAPKPTDASSAEDAFITDVLEGPGNVLKLDEDASANNESFGFEKGWAEEADHKEAKADQNATRVNHTTNASAPMSGTMTMFHDMVTSSLIRLRVFATSMLSLTPKEPQEAHGSAAPESLVQDSSLALKSHGQRKHLMQAGLEQRELIWDSLSSGMGMMSGHDMGPSR